MAQIHQNDKGVPRYDTGKLKPEFPCFQRATF